MAWVKFTDRTRGAQRLRPHLTIRANRAYLNKRAVEVLGNPEFVSLWHNAEPLRIAIQAEKNIGAGHFKVAGPPLGRSFSFRAFQTYHGLPAMGKWVGSLDGDMLVFEMVVDEKKPNARKQKAELQIGGKA